MLKVIFFLFTLFLFVACSSVNQKTSPPSASDYLEWINKKLLEKSGNNYLGRLREPKVTSTNFNASVEASSSVCTVNGIADVGGTVNFYFKRYCSMHNGSYSNAKCIGPNNNVIFTTKAVFSRSCPIAGTDNLVLRTLKIIKPLSTNKQKTYNPLAEIEVN
jgi:hypothetical protein